MRVYKKLINEQCEEVCQNQTTAHTILSNIEGFTFGFLHISKKSTASDRQSLNGFAFCTYTKRDNHIMIDIVCSRAHKKLGKKLMDAVEEEAIEMGVSSISLMSLAEAKLKRWYESLGFKVRKAISSPYMPEEVKVYLMVKYL
jgi:predicted N-acetyltransferase YhbS